MERYSPRKVLFASICVLSLLLADCDGVHVVRKRSISTFQGVPSNKSAANQNTKELNLALSRLQSGGTLKIPNETFWLAGGVTAVSLNNVTIQLDGTLKFVPGRKGWPTESCTKKRNPLQPPKNGTCVQEAVPTL